jgi:hypothetical protein
MMKEYVLVNKLYLVFFDDVEGLFLKGCFSSKELADSFAEGLRNEFPRSGFEYGVFETTVNEEFKPYG